MIPRSLLVALSWGTVSIALPQSNNLPTQNLPVYGGAGGTAFTRSCGAGRVLTGLRFRAGSSVDAVGLLCRPINSNGGLGSETLVGTLVGGGGGTSGSRSCPPGSAVVEARIFYGSFVDGIALHCRDWDSKSRKVVDAIHPVASFGRVNGNTETTEHCEAPTQPGKGIQGRAGLVVDAIGFICDEP